ncbi:hypothetical protein ACH34W_15815 [Actinomadura sp. 6N118]
MVQSAPPQVSEDRGNATHEVKALVDELVQVRARVEGSWSALSDTDVDGRVKLGRWNSTVAVVDVSNFSAGASKGSAHIIARFQNVIDQTPSA